MLCLFVAVPGVWMTDAETGKLTKRPPRVLGAADGPYSWVEVELDVVVEVEVELGVVVEVEVDELVVVPESVDVELDVVAESEDVELGVVVLLEDAVDIVLVEVIKQ